VAQGQHEEGSAQLQQGMAIYHVAGPTLWLPYFLLLQAESYGTSRHPAQGLQKLDEALQLIERTGGRWCAAELWRLKGELTLQKFQVSSFKSEN
jgi:predicted ATPase